jgi:dihydropteroate synthase
MKWHARRFEFRFPRPMAIMGILNVTPDSFWDGGRFADCHAAVGRAHALVLEGAEIIDIGGESTRPGAEPLALEEELRRVLPVIEALAGRIPAVLSIDTRKVEVARAALAAGVSIVNDVAANREDPAMWRLVAETGAGYVCMHSQGTPQTMQERPFYREVVAEVAGFFQTRLATMENFGVHPEQVVLDAGIGFGKNVSHNLELIANLNSFTNLQRPLLLGVSRKSFIGKLFQVGVEARMPGSVACACWAAQAGVAFLRTHDVDATRQAVRTFEMLEKHHTCSTG